MTGLLTITVSNADSERGFLILRFILTRGPVYAQKTLISLMTIKSNYMQCIVLALFEELVTQSVPY